MEILQKSLMIALFLDLLCFHPFLDSSIEFMVRLRKDLTVLLVARAGLHNEV